MDTSTSPAGSRAANRSSFRSRHPLLIWILPLSIILPLVAGGAYLWNLNAHMSSVGRIDTGNAYDGPDADDGKPLNILLIGSDKGEPQEGQSKKTTVAQDTKADTWPVGKYRSDTLMVIHVPADRSQVFVVSIPRDSFVPIFDAEGNETHSEKINSAFSDHGPLGTLKTVENLTGLKMNHLAIIDWDGFKDLSTAVGGVPVTIPKTFYDPKQKITWEAGDHVLEGKEALAYVRTRYGLIGGDFDRIKRQQNFMRSLMGKMLNSDVSSNPVKLNKMVKALTRNLTVDEGWSTTSIAKLGLSLKGIKTDNVVFMTAPVAGTETIPVWGSIVRLDEVKSAELFAALKDGTMEEFLADHPDLALSDEETIR